jgi:hypothetical protein
LDRIWGVGEEREGECRLVIAGWAGRNQEEIERHIVELEELGVRRPRTTPLFYRVGANLLTSRPAIEVVGTDSSGEAEAVIIQREDALWVGVGSDHTDRKLETVGVTLSKQVCAKPVSSTLWRFDEVRAHWDQIILRSHAHIGGKRRLYQEGTLASLLQPLDLIERYRAEGGRFETGTAMFCGTVPVIGGFEHASRFEIELDDPVLKRTLKHAYDINVLPIAD